MLRKSDLQGYQAPGMAYKIVVTMFTDNTTIYLMEEDNFALLNSILSRWCKASGAKFNKSKTEITSIGSKQFRQKLQSMRTLNTNAQDRSAIRILSAWVGNKTNENTIWAPTLEKINASLKRWEKNHPMIEGRKIIIQRTIGGMTQYLTTAQGMPKDIEKALLTRAREFAWDNDGKAQISTNILCAPIEKGRKNMLNLTH
ncbi:hypothetical protein C8R48DRAFT_749171 [Suillus tomentosus]|nr:hypothetical protein C8R48DRAFT_749171 [Suillus tomentosus]